MRKLLLRVKNLNSQTQRVLFVLAIVGVMVSSFFFDSSVLITSQSSKDYLDYTTNYQNGGEDDIAIGISKFLFLFALIITALTEKFNWVVIILHLITLGLELFLLFTVRLTGMVSYWHTIIYNNSISIFFFFMFLLLYIVMLLLYIIKLINTKVLI
ncbi:hypothetical protein [Treponema pedis]|uniref:hypothetical protein n=1 Tax=Treponema pedis TaxID=409322 RepID=UPI000465CC45|nr:hypothetical protein [Treponema pedis]